MIGGFIAALLVLGASEVSASETAAFLDIGVGARALAMGGAYTALSDGSDSVFWNPAGLARLDKREVSLSHAELANNTRHDYLSYAHPTSRVNIGGAVTYLSHGALDGRDSLGRPTGGYDASDAAGALAFALKSEIADIGASVKYLRSHIASSEAQGFAVDAGIRRQVPIHGGNLILGAALRNLGPGLKYVDQRNDLPLRGAIGTAYRFERGHALAFEMQNGPRGAGTEGGVGAEYKALEDVLLRLGYTSKSSAANGTGFDAARGLTLGLGLRRGGYGLDYAAQAAGELGNTHRFTLSGRF